MGAYFSQLVHEAILSDGDASLKLYGVKLSKKDATSYGVKLVEQLGSKLNSLSIEGAKLKAVPSEICGRLPILKHLQLADNQLSELPNNFHLLSCLDTLIVSNNDFGRLPAPLMQLAHLRRLNMAHNSMKAIPDNFGDSLPSLAELDLSHNKLEDAATWPGLIKLNKLLSLDLSSNQLKTLPNNLSSLKELRTLILSQNDFSNINPLAKMTALQTLSLSRLQLDPAAFAPHIPGATAAANAYAGSAVVVLITLRRLESLDISHNKIVAVSAELLEALSRLHTLKLHNNKLLRLPKEIGQMTNLSTLYLQENQLIKIGKSIAQCTKLEILRCEFNNLIKLPVQMKGMQKLQCLTLHHNKLKIIPDPLYDGAFVAHLYLLSLEGNPLTPDVLKGIAEKGTREYVLGREAEMREEEDNGGKRKGRPSLTRIASQYGSLRSPTPGAAGPTPGSTTSGSSSAPKQRPALNLLVGSTSANPGYGTQRRGSSASGARPGLFTFPEHGMTPSGSAPNLAAPQALAATSQPPSSSDPGSPLALPAPPASPGLVPPGARQLQHSSSSAALTPGTKPGISRTASSNSVSKAFSRSKAGSSPIAMLGSPSSESTSSASSNNAASRPKSNSVSLTSASRVSGTTTSLADIVKSDPTLEVPAYSRFKEAFEKLLEHEDFSEARREELRKASTETKWEMMRIYKGNLVQLLSNNTARLEREKKFEAWQKVDKKVERLTSPMYFISSLKAQNISMSDMSTLKSMFDTAPLPWIYEFIDVGGISELARFLMHLLISSRGKDKAPQDLVKETEAISCMSVLASASSSMVMSAPDAIRGVVLCLASDQLATIKPALQLLVHIHSEHKYASKLIIQALEYTMTALNFPHRFTLLINLLSDLPHLKQDFDVKAETLSLISKMCDSMELIDRFLMRKELTKVGMERRLEELFDAPHHALQLQLERIEEATFADSEAVKTLAATDYRVLLRIQEEGGVVEDDQPASATSASSVASAASPAIGSLNSASPAPFSAMTPTSANSEAAPISQTAGVGALKVLVGELGTSMHRFTPTYTIGDLRKKLLQRHTLDHTEFYSFFFLSTNSSKMEGYWADDLNQPVAEIVSRFSGECIASFKMRPFKLTVDVAFNKTTIATELEPYWSVQQAIAHIVTTNGFSLESDYELSVLLDPDDSSLESRRASVSDKSPRRTPPSSFKITSILSSTGLDDSSPSASALSLPTGLAAIAEESTPRGTTPRFEVLSISNLPAPVVTISPAQTHRSSVGSASEGIPPADSDATKPESPVPNGSVDEKKDEPQKGDENGVNAAAPSEPVPAKTATAPSTSRIEQSPKTVEPSSETPSTTPEPQAPPPEGENAEADSFPANIPPPDPVTNVERPIIPIPSLAMPYNANVEVAVAEEGVSKKSVMLKDDDTLHSLPYSEFSIGDLQSGKVRLQLALKPAKVKIFMGDNGVMIPVDSRWTVTELLRHIATKVPEVRDTINDYGIMIENKQKTNKRRSVQSKRHSAQRSGSFSTSGSIRPPPAPASTEWLLPGKTLAFYDFDHRKHNLRMALRPRELYIVLPNGKEIALSIGFEESVSTVIKLVLTHTDDESGANYSLFSGKTLLSRRKNLRDAGVRPGDHLLLLQEAEPSGAVAGDELDTDIWTEPNTEEFTVYDTSQVTQMATPVQSLPYSRNSQFVTGISFNKLVERLTHPSDLDPDLLEIFLFTYRSFASPEQLFAKLCQRYNVPDKVGDKELTAKDTDTIRVRVYVFLTQWLDRAYRDIDDVLLEKMNIWVENEVQEERRPLLFSALNKVRTRKAASPESHNAVNIDISGLTGKPTLIDLDAPEIARQLTWYAFSTFAEIKPVEFFDCAWSKPKLEHLAPNVLEMIARFNHISNWAANEICTSPQLRVRRTKFVKIVKVASILRDMGNYHMLYALVSGWNNSAVSRLKWTLDKLPKPTKQAMQEMETLMSMEGSFKIYRETLKKSSGPCVPYIGILLKDLTFIEDGNPNVVNGLINWYKRRLVQSVVGDYLRSALLPYRLNPAIVNGVSILDIIRSLPILDENGLYDASLKAEPRGIQKPEQLL